MLRLFWFREVADGVMFSSSEMFQEPTHVSSSWRSGVILVFSLLRLF